MMYDRNGEWSAEVYEKKGQAHLDHAERLRRQAHGKREKARHMTVVGREGDQKAWLELEADALDRKAKELASSVTTSQTLQTTRYRHWLCA
jgi:hypothetical protein